MTQSPSINADIALNQAAQAGSVKATGNLKAAGQSKKMEQIDAAAKEFESVYLSEMIKPMFEGLSTGGMFGGGKGEEIFRDMMVDQYGKIMAERGGIGIADHVKAEMVRIQEQSENAKTQ